MANGKREAAKGVAKSNGQMVESVIRHPFLTRLFANTKDQVGCLFFQDRFAASPD
jgi:hypothetical protein